MGRKVLVVGGGGREHALGWRLAGSRSVDSIESAPGNPGLTDLGPVHAVQADDPRAVADLAQRRGVDLVVIGPEIPLVAGVADELTRRDIAVFGPSAAGAEIEGSKAFAKEIMAAAGAPTAGYGAYTDPAQAKSALEEHAGPWVVKADGLAAGKGVRVCDSIEEARSAVDDALIAGVFGSAGSTVVIEEFLDGPEVSVFGVCDGRDAVLLPPAQDYKRALDGDHGLNTGGMGAYTPVASFGAEEANALLASIFQPVLAALSDRGITYRGLLYAGLSLTTDGPKLIEFNCRFGDPETQVVVPRLSGDLGDLLWASATGSVDEVELSWHDDAFVTVVLASGGYPGDYVTGKAITGIEQALWHEGAVVFHAGTRRDEAGRLVTAGGRVLNVTGRGGTVAEARQTAYAAADEIHWDGLYRRSDVGQCASRQA